jgi:hypothetical protein
MSVRYKHGEYRISISDRKDIQNKVVIITDMDGNDALGGGGGSIQVDGKPGDVIVSDGNGGVASNGTINIDVDGNNGVLVLDNMSVTGEINATEKIVSETNVHAEGDVEADGYVIAKKDVIAGEYVKGAEVQAEDVKADYLALKDTVSGDYYKIQVTNGQLVVSQI